MGTTCDFRQIYCKQNAIAEDNYAEHLLQRALPAHARAFRLFSLLTFQNVNHFSSDFDFINDVGCLRHYRDYNQSVDEFHVHPWNRRSLLRRLLRLRVSTNRVRRIVREQLKTKSNSEAQPAMEATSAPEIRSAAPSASAMPQVGLLSDENKARIKARIEQISSTPTPPSPQPKSLPEHSHSAADHTPEPQSVQRNAQSRTATLHQGQSKTAVANEIDVLRVINERLKCDLARVTAQRDILKQAAVILAAP